MGCSCCCAKLQIPSINYEVIYSIKNLLDCTRKLKERLTGDLRVKFADYELAIGFLNEIYKNFIEKRNLILLNTGACCSQKPSILVAMTTIAVCFKQEDLNKIKKILNIELSKLESRVKIGIKLVRAGYLVGFLGGEDFLKTFDIQPPEQIKEENLTVIENDKDKEKEKTNEATPTPDKNELNKLFEEFRAIGNQQEIELRKNISSDFFNPLLEQPPEIRNALADINCYIFNCLKYEQFQPEVQEKLKYIKDTLNKAYDDSTSKDFETKMSQLPNADDVAKLFKDFKDRMSEIHKVDYITEMENNAKADLEEMRQLEKTSQDENFLKKIIYWIKLSKKSHFTDSRTIAYYINEALNRTGETPTDGKNIYKTKVYEPWEKGWRDKDFNRIENPNIQPEEELKKDQNA